MADRESQPEAFHGPEEMRAENIDEIEGAGQAGALRTDLARAGFDCGEVFPEDFGWVFYASGQERRYFLAISLDPWNAEEDRVAARQMYGRVTMRKVRSLADCLLGRNREGPGEAVPRAVEAFLRGLTGIRDLKDLGA